MSVGCHQPSTIDWNTIYADARARADRHDSIRALELAEHGFRETGSDPVLNYKFRTLYTELLTSKDWKQSLQLLEIPPPPELSAGEFAARQRISQTLSHIYEGNLARARSSLDQAKAVASSGCPELLGRIALIDGYLDDVQDQKGAEQKYRTALQLSRSYKQAALEADALVNLGRLLAREERFDEAIDQLSLALIQIQGLSEALAEEKTLGNLGWSYSQLGNLDQAASLLQHAEEAAQKIGQRTDRQDWVSVLGSTYLSKRDYGRSENYFVKSLALAEEINNKDLVVGALHNLAQLELEIHNVDRAEEYNQRAVATAGVSFKGQLARYLELTSAEIAKGRGQFSSAEALLKDILRDETIRTNLRWQAESDLANVYVAQNKFAEAEREFQKTIQLVERTSEKVKQEDRRMSILDVWPFYDDYVGFLVDRGDFAKALQIAEFSRARTLAEAFKIKERDGKTGLQIPKVQVTQIQSYLRANNQIILAYWIADKESYLWAITPAKFQLFRLPGRDKIERAIQFNSGYIDQRRSPGDSPAAQELYDMLVKPAQALIPKNAHVIVAPNRSLYKLNFETLVVPGSAPRYWIEDVTVQSASSIALVVNSNHRHSQTTRQMLLMGAPVEASREFPVLQNAGEEVKRIENHMPAGHGRVVSGKDATPQAYRSSNPGQYRLIHFVTHGTASQMSPLDSAIILSADAENSYKLYAREIKDIPVHAELVTISACESAGKKAYAGEGLVGLAWAFMRAGAHQVVAALWEVDDASTPQLMDDFYSELGKGKSAVDALHDAKLHMLRSGNFHKPPYYWASLQLYTGS